MTLLLFLSTLENVRGDVVSEGAVRSASPRAYEPDAQTAGEMPLQTLLALVYLNQQLHTSNDPEPDPRAGRLNSIVSALYDIATGRSSLQDVLAYVVEAARAGTEASASVIALREGDQFVCCARSGPNAPDLGAQLNPNTGISGECIRSGAIMRCDETWADPRVNAAACRRLRVRSVIAVPIHHRRKVTGVLEVLSERPGAFGDQQTITLQLLSSLITHALHNEESAANITVPAPQNPEQPLSPIAEESLLLAPAQHGCSTGDLLAIGASEASASDKVTLAVTSNGVPHPFPLGEGAPAAASQETSPTSDQPHVSPEVIATPALFATLDVGQNRERNPLRIAAVATLVLISVVLCAQAFLKRPKPTQSKIIQAAQTATAPTPAPLPQPPAGPAQLKRVDVQSADDTTSINISLGRKVLFTSGRLSNPERVYFDLEDTQIDPAFSAMALTRIAVHDARVSQVRVAKGTVNVTRLVLDLKCVCEFSAAMSGSVPATLDIVVRRAPGSTPPTPSTVAANAPAAPGRAPSVPAPSFRATALPNRMVVVLDPGHGGPDLGTVGPNGLQEKDLALDIAQRLGRLLKQNLGAEVLFTRTDDQFVSLEARSAMANQAHADLVLSIHANSASDASARGVETFYFPSGRPSPSPGSQATKPANATLRLASIIQRNLHTALRQEDAHIRNRGVKQANFVLLTNAEVPAVLTEVAFLSSPSDERKLQMPAARDTIAAALYRGVAEFFSWSRHRARLQVHSAAAQPVLSDSPLHGSAPAALQ